MTALRRSNGRWMDFDNAESEEGHAMKVKLKVLEGAQANKHIDIPLGKFFIGRAADCQIQCTDDLVSRHHCVLIFEKDLILVRDFESTNGTYINGERIAGERELKIGDEIQIGPLKFEVVIDHALGGKKRAKVKNVSEALARVAGSGDEKVLDVSEYLQDDTPAEPTDSKITEWVSFEELQEAAEKPNTEKESDFKKEQKPKVKPMLEMPGADEGTRSTSAAGDALRKKKGL